MLTANEILPAPAPLLESHVRGMRLSAGPGAGFAPTAATVSR